MHEMNQNQSELENVAKEAGFNVTHLYGLTETYGPSVVNDWNSAWDDLPAAEQAVFKARPAELSGVDGISEKRSRSIAEYRDWDAMMKDIERVESEGVRLVFHGDDDYPVALYDIGQDAPLMLYVKGDVREEDRYAIAMV